MKGNCFDNFLCFAIELNVGTVRLFKMNHRWNVPPFKIHYKGTVPLFKMHHRGTLKKVYVPTNFYWAANPRVVRTPPYKNFVQSYIKSDGSPITLLSSAG